MAHISHICKRTVVSSKPVESGITCQLSVLDRIMEKNNVRIVLYYKNSMKKDGGEIRRKLTDSLAELLNSYPIISGRLANKAEGHWMINCNDAGVRIVEAKVQGSVEEWLRNVNRDKELELVHWEDMLHKPYFWSTLYIQLTEFKQGGIAIGLSCSHLLADPICATMFLKAWTQTTLGRTMTSPPFFHPLPPRRPNINHNHHRHYYELINCYKNYITLLPAPHSQCLTTITLEFSHQMVRACMSMHQGLTLTPFQALAALFWVAISKIKGSKLGLINMSVCLDMRNVLGLDKGFFGNCMIYNKVEFSSPLEHNDELMVLEAAGLAIKNVAKKMDNEGITDLVEWLECSNNHQSLSTGHDFICVNLENVEAYNFIFDDQVEKPIRASYYIEPMVGEGHLLILPSPKSGNRVVMVTLPGDEAFKLCQEDLLIKFSPTISTPFSNTAST